MNMATAVRFYVDKIVADPKISGPSAPRVTAPLVWTLTLGINSAECIPGPMSTPCVFVEYSFIAINCKLPLMCSAFVLRFSCRDEGAAARLGDNAGGGNGVLSVTNPREGGVSRRKDGCGARAYAAPEGCLFYPPYKREHSDAVRRNSEAEIRGIPCVLLQHLPP